jgi:hypothetical protein
MPTEKQVQLYLIGVILPHNFNMHTLAAPARVFRCLAAAAAGQQLRARAIATPLLSWSQPSSRSHWPSSTGTDIDRIDDLLIVFLR